MSTAIKAKGVDTIACIAVNDVHVMNAWAKATGAEGKIMMLADGNGEFRQGRWPQRRSSAIPAWASARGAIR